MFRQHCISQSNTRTNAACSCCWTTAQTQTSSAPITCTSFCAPYRNERANEWSSREPVLVRIRNSKALRCTRALIRSLRCLFLPCEVVEKNMEWGRVYIFIFSRNYACACACEFEQSLSPFLLLDTGASAITEMLLKAGASVNTELTAWQGHTALLIALRCGHQKYVSHTNKTPLNRNSAIPSHEKVTIH